MEEDGGAHEQDPPQLEAQPGAAATVAERQRRHEKERMRLAAAREGGGEVYKDSPS